MAIVRAGAGALRMDELNITRDGAVAPSPTNIRVTYDPAWYTDFGGAYTFTPSGISGTTTGISETKNGRTLYTVTDANADANTLFQLIDSGDILAAAAYVLRDDDSIYGGKRGDALFGFGGEDRIDGRAGMDSLFGGDGDDRIDGGADGDTLVGGQGLDRLTGGSHGDTFLYTSTAESTTAKPGRDTITDFNAADGDKIDLFNIDAIAGNDTLDAFTFVDRFHGVAGELMVKQVRGGFLVQGDTDGVGGADFAIFVAGAVAPVEADFNL